MLKKEIKEAITIQELEKIKNSLDERSTFLEEMLDDVFDDERISIEEELNEISKSRESLKLRRNELNDMI